MAEMAAALSAAASRMSPLGAAAVLLATWLPALRRELRVPPATQVAVQSLASSHTNAAICQPVGVFERGRSEHRKEHRVA